MYYLLIEIIEHIISTDTQKTLFEDSNVGHISIKCRAPSPLSSDWIQNLNFDVCIQKY